MNGIGTGTMGRGTATRRHVGGAALALWLVLLMLLAPILGAVPGAPHAGQIVPALFAVALLALGALGAAGVGRAVLSIPRHAGTHGAMGQPAPGR